VWNAICDLAEEYDIEVDSVPDTTSGFISFFDDDDVIELSSEGVLFMSLRFHGSGHGVWPDCADEMLERLGDLTDVGGAVEIFDLDVSATNEDECCSVRFVGPTQEIRNLAQGRYGMDKAKDWLMPVIGLADYAVVLKTALQDLEDKAGIGYVELKVTARSRATFGTDALDIRVFRGQSVKDVAARRADSYGADVVSISNADGTPYSGPDMRS